MNLYNECTFFPKPLGLEWRIIVSGDDQEKGRNEHLLSIDKENPHIDQYMALTGGPVRIIYMIRSRVNQCIKTVLLRKSDFLFSRIRSTSLAHPIKQKTRQRRVSMRSRADSNRSSSFCRAEPSHSATGPF
jgi:hypothetical protein